MTTEAEVTEALRTVYDPELGLNIVDLGLIYGVDIQDGKVSVRMTLTTQGCPMHNAMTDWTREAVERLPDVKEVDVQVVFDPPWTPERMSEAAREELGL